MFQTKQMWFFEPDVEYNLEQGFFKELESEYPNTTTKTNKDPKFDELVEEFFNEEVNGVRTAKQHFAFTAEKTGYRATYNALSVSVVIRVYVGDALKELLYNLQNNAYNFLQGMK